MENVSLPEALKLGSIFLAGATLGTIISREWIASAVLGVIFIGVIIAYVLLANKSTEAPKKPDFAMDVVEFPEEPKRDERWEEAKRYARKFRI